MKRARFIGAFLLCVVWLAGCSGNKKDDKASAVKLPQQVALFDGAVKLSLPDGWAVEPMTGSSDLAFVIVNSQALYDNTQDKNYISNFATGAFVYAYDPTVVLKDSDLPIKENVAVGTGVVMDIGEQDAKKSPSEMLQFFYEQAAQEVINVGSDAEIAAKKAFFALDKSKIKTFNNGALAPFNTAGGLTGVLGAVAVGQNLCTLFLVTDQPDQYLDTFEAIIRSVQVTEGALPVPTPAPTMTPAPTATITPTVARPTVVMPSATPLVSSGPPTLPAGPVVEATSLSVEPVGVTPLPVEPVHVETPVSVETIPPVPPTTSVQKCVYIVQTGDTLFGIAASLDVSVSDLIAANPSIGDGSQLQVEDQLLIPGCSE
jgi:LysM repeat protein